MATFECDNSDDLRKRLQRLPPEYRGVGYQRISPLEAGIIGAKYLLSPTRSQINELCVACEAKKFELLTLYLPIDLFAGSTFAVNASATVSMQLFTSLCKTPRSGTTSVPAEPVQIPVPAEEALMLLTLFIHLAYLGTSHGDCLSAYVGDQEQSIQRLMAERLQLADKLHRNSPWGPLLAADTMRWAPFFVEECLDNTQSGAAVGVRFWLFVRTERPVMPDFETMLAVLKDRIAKDSQARKQILNPPKSKKHKPRRDDEAEDEDADEPVYDQRHLLRTWEQPLINLVNMRYHGDRSNFKNEGLMAVFAEVRSFMQSGDRIVLPPKVAALMPGNLRFDRGPFATFFQSDAAYLQELSSAAEPQYLKFKDTHHLSRTNVALATHLFRSNNVPPIEQPFQLAHMFSAANAFSSWVSTQICSTQRNLFNYFHAPNDYGLRDGDLWEKLNASAVDLDMRSMLDSNTSYGCLLTSMVSKTGMDPLNMATHFRGFPELGRVHLVSPAVMPWMWPILVQPHLFRTDHILRESRPIFASIVKQHDAAWRMAFVNASKTQQWPFYMLLAYASKPILLNDHTDLVRLSKDIAMPETATDLAKVEAEKRNGFVDILTPATGCDLFHWALNIEQLRLQNLAQSIALFVPKATSRIAWEGQQPKVPVPGAVRDSTINETMNVATIAYGLDYFLWLNNFHKHLQNLKKRMVGSHPVSPNTQRYNTVRLLDAAVSQIMLRAFEYALHTQAPPMSEAVRAIFSFYNSLSPSEHYPNISYRQYNNLSVLGTLVAYFNTLFIGEWHVYAHVALNMLCTLAALGAHSREGLTTKTSNALMLIGPGGSGKSWALACLYVFLIIGTVILYTSSTLAARKVHANNEGSVYMCEEFDSRLTNSKDRSPATSQQLDEEKNAVEAGMIQTVFFNNSTTNQEGAVRTACMALNLCYGTRLTCTNHDLQDMERALLQRYLQRLVGHVGNAPTITGGSLQDYAIYGKRPDPNTPSATVFRTFQCYTAIIYRLQQIGVLPMPNMDNAVGLISSIFAYMKKSSGSDSNRIRFINHTCNLINTLTNLRAHTLAMHDDFYRDIKYVPNVDGTAFIPTKPSLEAYIERVRKHLVVTKEIIVFILTLLRDELDQPLRHAFLTIMAQKAYPNGNVRDAQWLQTTEPDTKRTIENCNYVMITLPGKDYNAAVDLIGVEIGALTGSTFVSAQLAKIIETLRQESHKVSYQTDANNPSVDCYSPEPSDDLAPTIDEVRNYTNDAVNDARSTESQPIAAAATTTTTTTTAAATTTTTTTSTSPYSAQPVTPGGTTIDPARRLLLERISRSGINTQGIIPMDETGLPTSILPPVAPAAAATTSSRSHARVFRSHPTTTAAPANQPTATAAPVQNAPAAFERARAVTRETPMPVLLLLPQKTQGTFNIAILHRVLKRYAPAPAASTSPATTSNATLAKYSVLWKAITAVIGAANLNNYPDEWVTLLEDKWPNLKHDIVERDTIGNIIRTIPVVRNRHGHTLRESLQSGSCEVITGIVDTKEYVQHSFSEIRAALSRPLQEYVPENGIFDRYMRPEVINRRSKPMILCNLTGLVDADRRFLNKSLDPNALPPVRVLQHDIDAEAVKYLMQEHHVSLTDPAAVEYLCGIPHFTPFISCAIAEVSMSDESFPRRSVQDYVQKVVLSQLCRARANVNMQYQEQLDSEAAEDMLEADDEFGVVVPPTRSSTNTFKILEQLQSAIDELTDESPAKRAKI